MISISSLKSPAQAASYYERDDYYTRDQGPSRWWGEGAARLGLHQQVDHDVFRGLLEGKLPDGTQLPVGTGAKRRIGYDLTFSPPKSVSLMALVAGDDRVAKAHKQAVTTSLSWLQRTSMGCRMTTGGQTERVQTDNLLAARFDHETSRELDPQLHTHVVVLNVTQRPDGALRALDNATLY